MINETVTAIHEALSVRMVAAIWPPSLVKRQLNQAGRHENKVLPRTASTDLWHKVKTGLRVAAIVAIGGGLAACTSMGLESVKKDPPKLSSKMLAQMSAKSMRPESPVLVRIFKQESELEVWKVDKTGSYALLKTYPMCRWSGKLGPKMASGDRQAPEGFYHVSAGMLNPNSQYYVSFNLGYPNRLESALGYTGEALMVHGACSSSGCYAMTDAQVGEIYAVVAKALQGGQDRFQVRPIPSGCRQKHGSTSERSEHAVLADAERRLRLF